METKYLNEVEVVLEALAEANSKLGKAQTFLLSKEKVFYLYK